MHNFLTPVLALILWTLIIWIIMYSRLIPHLRKNNVESQSTRSPEGKWRTELPDNVQYGIHNYNHLLEQPTIFYALMFYLHLSVTNHSWSIYLAWTYVVLRIAHSIIQIVANNVMLRFTVFTLSTICLLILTVKEVLILL